MCGTGHAPGAPDSVSPDFGDDVELEGRYAGGLQLIRHVGMEEVELREGRWVRALPSAIAVDH